MVKIKNLSPVEKVELGCLAIGLFVVALFFTVALLLRPPLLDAFPAYPNGSLISSGDNKYPANEKLDFTCVEPTPFNSQKWQIFSTTDNVQTIHNFYSKAATKIKNVTEYQAQEYRNQYALPVPQNTFCYTDKNNIKYAPTNVIAILDHTKPDEDRIIKLNYPDVPANENVIISLQGLMPYE